MLIIFLFIFETGPEIGQERGSDGEHWVPVEWWPCARRQGWSCQDWADKPRLHRGRREDRSESACRETLEVTDWLDLTDARSSLGYSDRRLWCDGFPSISVVRNARQRRQRLAFPLVGLILSLIFFVVFLCGDHHLPCFNVCFNKPASW